MDYIEILPRREGTVVRNIRSFSAAEILDCGQCFRWENTAENTWRGVAFGRVCTLVEEEGALYFPHASVEEFKRVWFDYFDFGRDYNEIKALLCQDKNAARAVDFCPGMRVLRQEPWEALCSFIISQNNNIKRIRGIVARLCEFFGEPLGDGLYAFPAPQRLTGLQKEDLEPLRCGFRAEYILHAAQMVAGGDIDLQAMYTMNLDSAREQLRRIRGVGPKVAECALLYGMGRVECVPVDVWISRVLERMYPQGLPSEMASVGGIAQQYLFHYARHSPAFAGDA